MNKEDFYKTACIIFLVVIAAILYGWHNSEQNRLKLLDELQEQEYKYETKIEELNAEIEGLKEELY